MDIHEIKISLHCPACTPVESSGAVPGGIPGSAAKCCCNTWLLLVVVLLVLLHWLKVSGVFFCLFLWTNSFKLLRSHVLKGREGDFVIEMLGVLNSNVDISATGL